MPDKTPLKISLAYKVALVMLAACHQPQSSQTSQTAPAQGASSTAPHMQTAQAPASDPLVRGAKLFKRCSTCHTLEQGGRHKVGPNLWSVYGSVAGSRDGFAYSKAMQAFGRGSIVADSSGNSAGDTSEGGSEGGSGVSWSDDTLDAFLQNPAQYIPKNRMTYVGLRKAEDRTALLAYLKAQTTPAKTQ